MNEFDKLIRDDVLDKEQLILRRYQFLNLDSIQAQYLSKLFANKEVDMSAISLQKISDILSIPLSASEALTKDLVAKELVGITKKDDDFVFNYVNLINKLIRSYIAPEADESSDSKLNWIVKTIDFELTDSNKEDLKLIIDENGWENLKIATNKLISLVDPTWHQLISMYEALGAKEKTDSQELKAILDTNWLEE